MPQIIPIRDLRDTTKISEMCNATNEPIFVTNMYKKIMEGKAQADRGKLKDGPSVMEKLRSKYGG